MALTLQTTIIASIVTIIIATVFVYVAARIVVDRSSILAALGTVLLGTFLAGLIASFVPGALGIGLAAAAWALVAGAFFRATWLKGAVIGLVAWALWALTLWLIGRLT